MKKCLLSILLALFVVSPGRSQQKDTVYTLQPDRVFDGETMHTGWQVQVQGDRIIAAGAGITPVAGVPNRIIRLTGTTLLPGLIEGHSHLLLHPYNETKWDEQVLNESSAERVARAVVHAQKTLLAGFTTVRDLGTEGSGYDDVGLKAAIEKGVIPGPRMIIATRAIVASGSYGPKTKNLNNIIAREVRQRQMGLMHLPKKYAPRSAMVQTWLKCMRTTGGDWKKQSRNQLLPLMN
jgi:imidazolonepropionase-like amidohydrolase